MIPVSSICFFDSSSANGGGSRWIGHHFKDGCAGRSASSGSPISVVDVAQYALTHGHADRRAGVLDRRAFDQAVGHRSAIARTVESPMRCATLHVIVVVCSSSVRSTVSAAWISGSSAEELHVDHWPDHPHHTPFGVFLLPRLRHRHPSEAALRASAPPTISMISVVISS